MWLRIKSFANIFLLSVPFLWGGMSAEAQNSEGSVVSFEPLTEYGSKRPAFTIFTNPGEDCSTTMNISWATPPGKLWEIELTDVATGESFIYDFDESFFNDVNGYTASDGKQYKFPYVYSCDTYNNIPSVLADKTKVTEKHVFDKHGYDLYSLEPNKEYEYRIVTFDSDNPEEKEYSDIHRFRTAGADSWKAALIGDFHHYSPSKRRINAAMGMLDVLDSVSGGFDWVLSPGDVVAWGGSYNFWTELSEQPNYKNYMWATVQGNHDTMTSKRGTSDKFFRDANFFPYNGYQGQEGVVYWFRYGDVLFLMLNNEAMRNEDALAPALEWMETVVEENPSKYIVVVQHYQWLSGTNGASMQLDKFYPTFDKLGVDLAIAGNNHVYMRTLPLKDRQPVEPEEGTYYVVTPSSDSERGREMKKAAANGDIIKKRWSEGENTVGGMIMDVNPERIEMTLYNRYGKVQDTFTVPAKR